MKIFELSSVNGFTAEVGVKRKNSQQQLAFYESELQPLFHKNGSLLIYFSIFCKRISFEFLNADLFLSFFKRINIQIFIRFYLVEFLYFLASIIAYRQYFNRIFLYIPVNKRQMLCTTYSKISILYCTLVKRFCQQTIM